MLKQTEWKTTSELVECNITTNNIDKNNSTTSNNDDDTKVNNNHDINNMNITINDNHVRGVVGAPGVLPEVRRPDRQENPHIIGRNRFGSIRSGSGLSEKLSEEPTCLQALRVHISEGTKGGLTEGGSALLCCSPDQC